MLADHVTIREDRYWISDWMDEVPEIKFRPKDESFDEWQDSIDQGTPPGYPGQMDGLLHCRKMTVSQTKNAEQKAVAEKACMEIILAA